MAAAAAAADHSLDSAARHGEQAQAGAAGGSGALLYHPFGRLSEDKCHSRDNTEMAGGVVGWGPTNKQPTAAACCQSCAAHNEKAASGGGGGGGGKQCDAWVWCGRSEKECGEHWHECWLKDQPGHTIDTYETMAYGPSSPWTSGFLPRAGEKQAPDDNGAKAYNPPPLEAFREGGGIHTVCTSNGNPYSNYQTRTMYATYKMVAAAPGGEAMKHFTRVLHRSKADILMDEVPTVRVHPRSNGECDEWCDFPVKDRPNAIKRWLQTEDAKRGEWILLVETDYVFVRPMTMPPPGSRTSYAFHFEYINTRYPRLPELWTELGYRGNVDDIPCSGPAPVLMRFEDVVMVADGWQVYTHAIEASEKAKKELGWVREMYAWSMAVADARGPTDLEDHTRYQTRLISQLPADDMLGKAAMFHYTWSTQYLTVPDKRVVWEWDKRHYGGMAYALRPRPFKLPPANWTGLNRQFPSFSPVTNELHEALTLLLGTMNEAIKTLGPLNDCGDKCPGECGKISCGDIPPP